jgi:hypothetical protein
VGPYRGVVEGADDVLVGLSMSRSEITYRQNPSGPRHSHKGMQHLYWLRVTRQAIVRT